MNPLRIALVVVLVGLSVTACQSPRGPVARRTPPKAVLAAGGTGGQPATAPTASNEAPPTPPGAGGPELLAPTGDMTGYGEESYRIVSRPDEVISVLKNGAVVICKRVASPVVSVRGYCATGGIFEGKWLGGGLSHLLEHLVAGGSTENRTEEQNRDLLQRIGNDSNAYTDNDHTAYFINTTTEHMDAAADLVCGWMLGAKITVPEYRREYQVVQRELEMGKGEPDRVFYYLSTYNRYRFSPMRVPVIGYQEVIQGLSRDDVYNYFKLAYVPNNLVFAIAGDVPPEKMLAAVQKHLKAAKPGRGFDHNIAPEPPVQAPRTVVATFPKLGQAKLELAFPSVRMTDPDLYALDLLATVLGGGESSVLVQVLRDEKQLVSGVSVMNNTPPFVDGSFGVDMELEPAKVQEATKLTLDLLAKVATDGVDEQRIARAKTQMKAARVKRLQTSEEVAEGMATDYLATGDAHFSEHYIEQIERVTPQQLKAVAAKYFDTNKLLTTALLPAEFTGAAGLPKAESLLRPASPATLESGPTANSEVQKIDLGNDTILLTRRITTSPLVVIQAYSLGGLTAEDEKSNGLGNLAMQMLSRGTKTKNAQQIAEFWDSIGGDFDAACGNNSWSWTATCLKEDFAKAYAQFTDQVNNPAFAEAELDPMKKRVLAAIQGQDADWTAQAFRFFKKTYYGPLNSPYQFMPIGTEQNVTGFKIDQVRDWYAKQVLGHKKVIAVFGDVDPKVVEEAVRKMPIAKADASATRPAIARRAGGVDPVPANGDAPRFSEQPPASGAHVAVKNVALNKTEQQLAGIVIGYHANSVVGDPANFPIAVGDTMASGYQYGAGYLYEILRGRGLVYVVHGQNSPGLSKDLPGTFLVYAGCEPDKVNEVVDVILENIARLQGTPAEVNEQWFRRSKELIVVAEAMENQTPAQQATQAALDELYGLGYLWHRNFGEKIKAVELPQVREISGKRLTQCVVTISTPKPELVKVKAGVRTYASFPKIDLTPRGVQHDQGAGAK